MSCRNNKCCPSRIYFYSDVKQSLWDVCICVGVGKIALDLSYSDLFTVDVSHAVWLLIEVARGGFL